MSAPNESPITDHRSPSYSPLGYPTNLLAPGQTYESVNKTIAGIPLTRALFKQARPHTSGGSDQLQARTNALDKENIRRFGAGLPLLNVVDKKEGF